MSKKSHEITINNEREFISHLDSFIRINKDNTESPTIIIGNNTNKYIFNYDFVFPLTIEAQNALEGSKLELPYVDYHFEIKNCNFNEDIIINNSEKNISFSLCDFNNLVSLNSNKAILTFTNCNFKEGKEINAKDSIFDGKIRFRTCHFKGYVNFRNTTFKNLADFWRCTFYSKTIFYKTDFMDIVVFSAVTFKEDVLFTYSLINKLLLLRGAKVEKGFDLSLSIITGKLGLFDFNLVDYKTLNTKTEEEYEKAVSEKAEIPIKNKRETFRIIKDNLESQKNLAESLKFKAIEKDVLLEELNLESGFSNFFEKLNLHLNRLSNNHGTSYFRAFIFIICLGWLFFYFSLLSTERFYFTWDISTWDFSTGFKLFVEFLNPIHKFDYIENTKLSSAWFYVFDFFGKTLVGYGIYQFIQAFRKYK